MFFALNLLLLLAAVVLILLVAATASPPLHSKSTRSLTPATWKRTSNQAGRLLVDTRDVERDALSAQVIAAGMQ